MDRTKILMMLPNIQADELANIQNLCKDMLPNQIDSFLMMYQGRRKDTQTLVLVTLLAFFGVAGIQRFIVGETLMGVLYVLTWGFCGIGQLIDLINARNITSNYNNKQAIEVASMVTMMR